MCSEFYMIFFFEDEEFEALKYQGKIEEKDLNDMLDKSKMKAAEEHRCIKNCESIMRDLT